MKNSNDLIDLDCFQTAVEETRRRKLIPNLESCVVSKPCSNINHGKRAYSCYSFKSSIVNDEVEITVVFNCVQRKNIT
ncbi:hypothetical protein J6590_092819 [Homalodisca vitripennis]|nr:hypothetical protein J6590_092819 [Homalodisca vitripennis]